MSEEESLSGDVVETPFTKLAKRRYTDAKNHASKWKDEARICYDMVAGHQLTTEERAALEEAIRPAIVFNRIDPVISSVTGHQINNRQEVRYIPRELGDIKVSEIYTSAASWVDDESDANDEVSDAFWDLVVVGMGWTETRISYDEDPEGKIYGAERVPPLEMSWDPSARKRNLADARYLFRGSWYNRKDAEAKWSKLKDIDLTDSDMWADMRDDDAEHEADQAWKYENDQSMWFKKEEDEVFILHYQYWELEAVHLVGDPQSGRMVEFDEKRYRRLAQRIKETGLPHIKQMRRKYKQAFLIGDIELEKSDCPCDHSFTLRSMTGKRDENKHHWYGLVRPMIDPQKWSNKFFAEIQDIMSNNRVGGAFIEESALTDPRKAEEIWNDPNPLIIVADGALAKGAIQERNPIQYPAGIDRMMEFAVGSIPQVTGINQEMMGLVDRNQPGVVESTRRRAGMTILAGLFDSLRRYHKERGRVLLYFIDEYISDGRLIRVIGEDGKERYVPLEKRKGKQKYDIIVSDAPTSPNQKEETFAILSQIVPMAIQMGIPLPPEVLDHMPLPSSLVEKWKKMLEDSRNNPAIKKAEQLDSQLKEAVVMKDKSITILNQAKAVVEKMEAKLMVFEQASKMAERGDK